MNDITHELCHWCDGSGKDEDAVRAASWPDNCPHCGGTGIEPEWPEDEDEEWDLTLEWEGDEDE